MDDKEFLTFEEALETPGLYQVWTKGDQCLNELFYVFPENPYLETGHPTSAKAMFLLADEAKWLPYIYNEVCPLVGNCDESQRKCTFKLHKTQHLEFSITLKQNEE